MMPDYPCDTEQEDCGDVNIYIGGPLTAMGYPMPDGYPMPVGENTDPPPPYTGQTGQPPAPAREPDRKEPNWPAGSWRWRSR